MSKVSVDQVMNARDVLKASDGITWKEMHEVTGMTTDQLDTCLDILNQRFQIESEARVVGDGMQIFYRYVESFEERALRRGREGA